MEIKMLVAKVGSVAAVIAGGITFFFWLTIISYEEPATATAQPSPVLVANYDSFLDVAEISAEGVGPLALVLYNKEAYEFVISPGSQKSVRVEVGGMGAFDGVELTNEVRNRGGRLIAQTDLIGIVIKVGTRPHAENSICYVVRGSRPGAAGMITYCER